MTDPKYEGSTEAAITQGENLIGLIRIAQRSIDSYRNDESIDPRHRDNFDPVDTILQGLVEGLGCGLTVLS